MTGWVKSLWKDSLVYGIGYGVSRFLQLIILPIITHALTLSEFGYYSNYVIFYTFAAGFFILGLDNAVARFFYDSTDKKYHQQIFSSALWVILGVSLGTSFLFSFFPDQFVRLLGITPEYTRIFYFVLLCIPVVTLNNFFLSWFKWKRQKFHFLANSGGTVLLLLIPLLLVEEVTFLYIFKVLFWSQFVIAVMSAFLAHDYIRLYFNRKLIRALLVYGFPWLLVFLFGLSRTYLDRVFLTGYLSPDVYGIYNFSVRVSTLILLVTTAFDMSFGPLAFSIWNKQTAPVFFARLQSIYILLIGTFACSICIFSPLIIRILGGDKYAGAENILPMLLFSAIPLSLINFSNLGINHAKKSMLGTVTLFFGLMAVLLLNLLLTHRYLQYGATTSSLIGHIVIIIVGYYFSSRYYRIPFSYVKDGAIFMFFFLLSVASVNISFSSNMYYEMLTESIILAIVVIMLVFSLFRKEYQQGLAVIGVR